MYEKLKQDARAAGFNVSEGSDLSPTDMPLVRDFLYFTKGTDLGGRYETYETLVGASTPEDAAKAAAKAEQEAIEAKAKEEAAKAAADKKAEEEQAAAEKAKADAEAAEKAAQERAAADAAAEAAAAAEKAAAEESKNSKGE